MKFRSVMTAICVLATANLAVAAPFAYVVNSGTKNVSVIDTADNTIKATVALPDTLPTIHPYAYSVAVGASGQYVYVGLQETKEVAVIDAATNTVIKRIGLGLDNPGGLAVNAAETRLYVASKDSNTLIVIDITWTPTEVGRVAVGNNPEGVVLSPAGDKAYVANSMAGTVAEIALDELNNLYTVTSFTTVGANPMGLALSSTGSKLYVADLNGAAKVVDTATMAVTNLAVGAGTLSVAVRPDGSKAYAPSNTLDKLYEINGSTDLVSGTQYDVDDGPFGSTVAPNNNLYLAMLNSDNVKVFNTTTNAVTATIALPAGAKPTSLGDFVGPEFPYTITSAAQAGCVISPLGVIPVNDKGRSFNIITTNNACEVFVGCNTTDFTGGTKQELPGSYAFTNVTANNTICAVHVPTGTYYNVTASWISSVGGSLVSTPAGINQASRSAQFLAGTSPTIKCATGFTATNWTGDCTGTTGATCTLANLSADKNVGATCVTGAATGPVYNATKSAYYQTMYDALAAAATNDVIKIQNTWTGGCTTAGTATVVTLSGNWSADYSSQSGSVSMGPLTITAVGVIADNLTI